MSNALKAALLSALVFPGFGHLFIKRRGRGFLIIAVVVISMVIIVKSAVQQAQKILDNMQVSAGVVDIDAVRVAATQAATTSDTTLSSVAIIVAVVVWLYAIVDAYKIGKQLDVLDAKKKPV